MKKLIVTSIILLSFNEVYAGWVCPGPKSTFLAQQLANIEVDIKAKLPELEFLKSGRFASAVEYEVEPAFTNGLYFRKDMWKFAKLNYLPTDSNIFNENLSLSGQIGPQLEIEATFIRLFQDPCDAMSSRFYLPNRMPLKSHIAAGNLFKSGDFFEFKGSLAFMASAELLRLVSTNPWGITLGASYLGKGEIQIQMIRLQKKSVRLKVIVHRTQSVGVSAGLGYKDVVEVFMFKPLDKQLKKLFADPVKVGVSVAADKVMMVDYVLDLGDPEVARAYNEVFLKMKDFDILNIANPLIKDSELEENLIVDLTPLENIYRDDFQNNSVGRIKRNLRASSKQKSGGIGFSLGNKFFGFEYNNSLATGKMSVREPNDELNKYLLRSWDNAHNGRAFFSWSRSSQDQGLRTLYATDPDFNVTAPVNVVHFKNKKKNRISYKDFQSIRTLIKKALPADVESQIPWGDWTQGPNEKFTNFGLRYQLVMAPEVFSHLPEIKKDELEILLRDYLKSKGLTAWDFYPNYNVNDTVGGELDKLFESDIRQFARLLEQVMDKKRTIFNRIDSITKLRRNIVFLDSGLGFIMALRPNLMKNLFALDINISSNESKIDFQYGTPDIATLYKKLLTIKAALDNSTYDLLREAESIRGPTTTGPEHMSWGEFLEGIRDEVEENLKVEEENDSPIP